MVVFLIPPTTNQLNDEIYIPSTADAIQRILCIAFLHSPNNIFQQQAFCFYLNMDHKLFP
jgi:hypothetical protein